MFTFVIGQYIKGRSLMDPPIDGFYSNYDLIVSSAITRLQHYSFNQKPSQGLEVQYMEDMDAMASAALVLASVLLQKFPTDVKIFQRRLQNENDLALSKMKF